jgi:Domain of unknown function (DUF5092)
MEGGYPAGRKESLGSVLFHRNSGVDLILDLSSREPISMCRYFTIALECLRQKKDLVLAIVITCDEMKREAVAKSNDYLERDLVSRGSVYLASSINSYRFVCCDSNPNVIWISKRDVRDPISQRVIEDIYYYGVFFKELREVILPLLLKRRANPSVDALAGKMEKSPGESVQRGSPESEDSSAMIEILFSSPALALVLRANYLGTEHDFSSNSVFNEYVRRNSLLIDEIPRKVDELWRSAEKEKVVFQYFLFVLLGLTLLSLSLQVVVRKVTAPSLCMHGFVGAVVGTMLLLNRVI